MPESGEQVMQDFGGSDVKVQKGELEYRRNSCPIQLYRGRLQLDHLMEMNEEAPELIQRRSNRVHSVTLAPTDEQLPLALIGPRGGILLGLRNQLSHIFIKPLSS